MEGAGDPPSLRETGNLTANVAMPSAWSRFHTVVCCHSNQMVRVRLVAAIVALLAVFVAPYPARAAYLVTSSDWDGLSDLLQLAKDEAGAANVVATSSLDYSALRPEDGVVLLHPESSLDVESLSRFLREGGRVAV